MKLLWTLLLRVVSRVKGFVLTDTNPLPKMDGPETTALKLTPTSLDVGGAGMVARLSTEYIAVHCTATKAGEHFDEDDIRRWHTTDRIRAGKRPWDDIGYNVVITIDGTIQIGRPIDARGAHVRGFNSRSVGVCLVGGLDRNGKPANTYTKAQFDALEATLRFLRFYAPKAKIQGHRDFPGVNKACPCFEVDEWCRAKGINPTP